MTNGVIKTFDDYQSLTPDQKELHNFQQQSAFRKDINEIKITVKGLTLWKVKTISFVSGISVVITILGVKVIDLVK